MKDSVSIETYQARAQSEARLALAMLELCERWYGRERVNAALERPGYSGLVELVQQIAPPGEP